MWSPRAPASGSIANGSPRLPTVRQPDGRVERQCNQCWYRRHCVLSVVRRLLRLSAAALDWFVLFRVQAWPTIPLLPRFRHPGGLPGKPIAKSFGSNPRADRKTVVLATTCIIILRYEKTAKKQARAIAYCLLLIRKREMTFMGHAFLGLRTAPKALPVLVVREDIEYATALGTG